MILKVRYRPFVATWQTYLGCSIILETSEGRTFDFIGSRSLEAEVCGEETQFSAASGQMITGFRLAGAGNSNPSRVIEITTASSSSYCTSCLSGQYKSALGTQACSSCPSDSTSPVTSQSISACICNAGFNGPAGGACTGCPSGTYKNDAGAGACSNCPSNSNSVSKSTSVLSCTCNVGFSGNDGSTCTPCAAGTYKIVSGPSTCLAWYVFKNVISFYL